ncbi:MAG: efflux RND transporter permease subunit [Chloroflexi bacterium]|nr:efflux RND transporter permease subunit [Chloroflexota bacterium]
MKFWEKSSAFLEQHSGWVILGVIVITLLLVVPLLTMVPEEDASGDPGGRVFDLQEEIDQRFPPSVHAIGIIVEARDGDILTQDVLWELYKNTERLRASDKAGELAPPGLDAQPYLFPFYYAEIEQPVVGIHTLADAVQDVLARDPRLSTTLENASDDQVKLALHQLFSDPRGAEFRDSLSVETTSEPRQVAGQEIDYWRSPAMLAFVVADNEKLGGGSMQIGVGGGEVTKQKEQFNRNVQEILRGDQESYRLWGIAIDVGLEIEDESVIAGPFIMFTVIAVLIVVGVSLRSYWAVALTGAGIGLLMIWLKGISNLIGLKSGLVIDFIVPIAMISLGVDAAIHALRRYGEEKEKGYELRMALRSGFVGVLGALTLAMLTDGVAFLSNVTSGIESIVGFGIGAGIAVTSSFVILGIVAPLAMMRVDILRGSVAQRRGAASRGRLAGTGQALAMGAAAIFTGVGIIFLIAIGPVFGIGLISAFIVLGILLPLFVATRLGRRRAGLAVAPAVFGAANDAGAVHAKESATQAALMAIVIGLARRRAVVLPLTVIITIAAISFALKLEATFDVKDFFDNKSDFVVSLDKLDEHVGETAGEPALVYIEGDLTEPQSLQAIQQMLERMKDNPYLARDAEGELNVSPNVFTFLARMVGSDYARAQVEEVTGVTIADSDDDGVPDTRAQIKATYDYMAQRGIPLDENTVAYSPSRIRETLFHDLSGAEEDVTVLEVGIPGSREQSVVTGAREAMENDLEMLGGVPSISVYGLTGSPFTREAGLNATTQALSVALPIAAVLCFLVILLFVRSMRYALVTIVPIGLVVAWLYAFMYLAGFALNYVTAIIAAVSIGVGIDYSTHMTQRFREELARAEDRMQAMRQAAGGTGMALLGSAASSIVGFTIMGLAPMPMFSAFGFITATMILMAAASALMVLPSLLMLVTPEREERG